MRTIIIILLAIGIGYPLFFEAEASSVKDHSYYKGVIEKKIDQCQNKSRFIHSKGVNLQCYGKHLLNKAIFFRKNKEQLVQAMVSDDTPKKEYAIDYFLNSVYSEHSDYHTLGCKSYGSEEFLSSHTKP